MMRYPRAVEQASYGLKRRPPWTYVSRHAKSSEGIICQQRRRGLTRAEKGKWTPGREGALYLVQHSRQGGFFTPGYEAERTSSSPFASSSSSSSSAPGGEPSERRARISDHEYEVRVGRAYDLLAATIPEFMRIGLVDYDQQNKQHDASSTTMTLLDVLNFRSLRDRAGEQGVMDTTAAVASIGDGEKTYHESIHFRFCAHDSPSPLSSKAAADLTDEEAASLSFSGRNLYFASAQVLRHTLNILFADSSVTIESIRRERRKKGGSMSSSLTATTTSSSSSSSSSDNKDAAHSISMRGDTIYLRVGFLGHLRVTGAEHHYTLVFRYEIDEESGKIIRHTVERIEPAIGRKLWSGLAAVWLRLTGNAPHPQPVASAVPMQDFHLQASSPSERHRRRLLDAHIVRQAQRG